MTTAIVVGIATLAGLIVLTFGRRSRVGDTIGLLGLIAVTLVASTIGRDSLILGTDAIVGTGYLRLFLVLGGSASIILVLIGLVVGSPTSVAGVALLTLAGGALALSVTDPVVAVLASTAAAVAAAVIAADRRSGPRITVAARALRATVVAGLLAFGGIVWLATSIVDPAIAGTDGIDGAGAPAAGGDAIGGFGTVAFGPGLIGLAYLAVTLGMAIRLGAIPFHGWAARIAEATPPAGMPATLALGPAALAVVVIAWLDGSVGTLGEPLILERGLILVLGALSLIFGAVAAWLHDDVEHVVAYSLVQDAGVILLAAAALDPASWAPVRMWILSLIVVKSALAAWAAATRHAFGTRRIPELGGWARRSPLLAIAFLIVLVAIVGLPGLAAYDARAELIAIVVDGPFAAVLLLAALAPLGYLGRILAIGFGPPSAIVRDAPTSRLSWPRGAAVEAAARDASEEAAASDGGPAGAAGPSAPARLSAARSIAVQLGALRPLGSQLLGAWRANRTPVAAALVIVLASLGLLTSAGGFGATRAAAESAPIGGSVANPDLEGPGQPGGEPDVSAAPSIDPPTGSPLASDDASEPAVTPPTDAAPGSGGSPGSSPGASPGSDPSAAPPGASPPPSFEPVPTASG